jgi:hypothetical protein
VEGAAPFVEPELRLAVEFDGRSWEGRDGERRSLARRSSIYSGSLSPEASVASKFHPKNVTIQFIGARL